MVNRISKQLPADHCRILAEHHELEAQFRGVATALADTYLPMSLLAQRLADLRDQLSRHFVREERSGGFLELRAESPRMAPKVSQLLRDHLELYAEIEQLADDALRATGSQLERFGLRERFAAFHNRFLAHEATEEELFGQIGHDPPSGLG